MPDACPDCVEQAEEFNNNYGFEGKGQDDDQFDPAPLSNPHSTRGADAHTEAASVVASENAPRNPYKTYHYKLNLFGDSDGYIQHYDPKTHLDEETLKPEHDPFADRQDPYVAEGEKTLETNPEESLLPGMGGKRWEWRDSVHRSLTERIKQARSRQQGQTQGGGTVPPAEPMG